MSLNPCLVPVLQPAALVEQLTTYKGSLEEVELREKQLAAMRVDVCSSAALRKLKGARVRLPLHLAGFFISLHLRKETLKLTLNGSPQIRPEARGSPGTLRRAAPSCRTLSSSWSARAKEALVCWRPWATQTSSMRCSTRR